MKIIVILFLLLSNWALTQERDSILLSEKNELYSFVAKKMDNPYSSFRTFQKIEGKENPIELLEYKKENQYYTEIYELLFDSSKTPLCITVTEFIDASRWAIVQDFFLDSSGKTIFYSFYLGCHDSLSNKLISKYHLITFSDDYEVLKESEWYEDENNNVIQEIPECAQSLHFNVDYSEGENFLEILKKYKIKL